MFTRVVLAKETRKVVATLVVLCLLSTGCSTPEPPPKSGPSRSIPPSVLEVPPSQMRQALVEAYRLPPDNRALLAVSEIHHFLSGDEKEPVTLEFQGEHWRVWYRDKEVGTLPEFPDFPDLLEMLSNWVNIVHKQHPLMLNSAQPDTIETDIEEQLDRFLSPHVAAALRSTDNRWNQGTRSATLLRLAARGLVTLNLQAFDLMEVGDALPAKALAMLALTQTLTQHKLVREECLLAHATGYSGHAMKSATKLPESDVVRLYVTHEDERLMEAAKQRNGTVEARYLSMMRLAESGRRNTLVNWQGNFFQESILSLPVLKTSLSLAAFDVNREFSKALPHLVLLELAREAGTPDFSERLGKFIIGLFDEDSRASLYEVVKTLRSLLGTKTSSLMDRFESDVQALDQKHNGPFLDSETYGSYFRGYFYTGPYILGKHYMDQLSSVDAVKRFAEDVADAHIGTAADFSRWYGGLARFKAGDADPTILLDDLGSLPYLGARPMVRTIEEVKKRVPYTNPMLFAAARHLAARMDTRVNHRLDLAGLAFETLFDLRLARTLYASVLGSVALYSHPKSRVWFAHFTDDQNQLRNLLRSPHVRPVARAKILAYFEKQKTMKADALQKEYRHLIDENPDNWYVRQRYVEYLEKIKGYTEARSVIAEWLDRNDQARGFSRIYARTFLAHMYYLEGHYQEGWAAVEPVVKTWHASPMKRAALLLDKMGFENKAEDMANALVSRYPDATWTRTLLAELYWRHGEHEKAAQALKSSPHTLSLYDWNFLIATKFSEVFAERPKEEVMSAFSLLLLQNFGHHQLSTLARRIAGTGHYDTAFEMVSRLHLEGYENLVLVIDGYTYLKRWKGRPVALKWLRNKVPSRMLNGGSVVIYQQEELDLLWDLYPDPVQGQHSDSVWLLRAASSIRLGPHDPHREALLNHYAKPGKGRYNAIGRYLMGFTTEEEVLSLATDPKKRCETAYFVGLRAVGERRYNDASDWFRVTMETGQYENGEYQWAYGTLQKWQTEEKSLSRIAADHLQRPKSVRLHTDPF